MICPSCEIKLKVYDSRPTSDGSNERLQKCKCPKCEEIYYVSIIIEYPEKYTYVRTEKLLTGYPT